MVSLTITRPKWSVLTRASVINIGMDDTGGDV
jgi:hypothetical protein